MPSGTAYPGYPAIHPKFKNVATDNHQSGGAIPEAVDAKSSTVAVPKTTFSWLLNGQPYTYYKDFSYQLDAATVTAMDAAGLLS